METTIDIEQLSVSIQGYAGAFHEAAARLHFTNKEVVTVPAHTFADVVAQVESGRSDVGLMAIENTLAGSLMANFVLVTLDKAGLRGRAFCCSDISSSILLLVAASARSFPVGLFRLRLPSFDLKGQLTVESYRAWSPQLAVLLP